MVVVHVSRYWPHKKYAIANNFDELVEYLDNLGNQEKNIIMSHSGTRPMSYDKNINDEHRIADCVFKKTILKVKVYCNRVCSIDTSVKTIRK